jgi:hypothetical protein
MLGSCLIDGYHIVQTSRSLRLTSGPQWSRRKEQQPLQGGN